MGSTAPATEHREPRVSAGLVPENWMPVVKNLGLVAGFLYAVGLLVSNEYLHTIWGSDFSLLKARCLVTGTWSTLVLILAALPVALPYLIIHRYPSMRIRGLVIGIIVGWTFSSWMSLVLFVFLKSTISSRFPHELPLPFSNLLPVAEITLVYGIVLCLFWIPNRFLPLPKPLALTLFLLASVIATWTLAVDVYPTIVNGLGGGKPEPVALVFDKEGARIWEQLCFLEAKDKALETGLVDLLYQGDTTITLRLHEVDYRNERIVKIDRKLVGAILYGYVPTDDSCTPPTKPPKLLGPQPTR